MKTSIIFVSIVSLLVFMNPLHAADRKATGLGVGGTPHPSGYTGRAVRHGLNKGGAARINRSGFKRSVKKGNASSDNSIYDSNQIKMGSSLLLTHWEVGAYIRL